MFFTLARISDFYLIQAELYASYPESIILYLTTGKTWNWVSDVQEARRFQYATEALNYAAANCPIRTYRYHADEENYIELNLNTNEVIIHRCSKSMITTLDTIRMIKDFTIPYAKEPTT